MREIVLDTETTGFEPQEGHRIVEIGAVELWNHLPTGKTYHQYINPEREMPSEAFSVHGLSDKFLEEKPVFSKIVDDFLDFVGNDILIIHNATFDIKFLNAELERCCKPKILGERAIDTLKIARRRFPGSPASLDALCRRFSINNASRIVHGALLDSEILAEVYLELIGGRQPDFSLSKEASSNQTFMHIERSVKRGNRPRKLSSRLTQCELEAHTDFIKEMGEDCIWKRLRQTL